MRRNPLDPAAWEGDGAPSALSRGVDDRRGVHFAEDKIVALWYAMGKAGRTRGYPNNTGVLFHVDVDGLDLQPDHDAKIAREHTSEAMRHLAYLTTREFDLDPDSSRDQERMADLIDGELQSWEPDQTLRWDGNVMSALYAQHDKGVEPVFAAMLTYEMADVIEALRAYDESFIRDNYNGDINALPLEWYATGIGQWRTFKPVNLDRVYRVQLVEPFLDTVVETEEEGENDEGIPFFVEDDIYEGLDEHSFNYAPVLERKPPRRRTLLWHGTDISRALAAFPELEGKLVNPWNVPFVAVR